MNRLGFKLCFFSKARSHFSTWRTRAMATRWSSLGVGHHVPKPNCWRDIVEDTMTYLVGGWPTPLKNMPKSVGILNFPTEWKIKFMFQTTNQICKVDLMGYTAKPHWMCTVEMHGNIIYLVISHIDHYPKPCSLIFSISQIHMIDHENWICHIFIISCPCWCDWNPIMRPKWSIKKWTYNIRKKPSWLTMVESPYPHCGAP